MTTWETHIPIARALLLQANDHSIHWHERARRTKALREIAALRWVAAHRAGLPPMRAAECRVALHFADRRRRDAANYTPTIKPLIDGMVGGPTRHSLKLGFVGILPDDDHTHLLGPYIDIADPRTLPPGIAMIAHLTLTERH